MKSFRFTLKGFGLVFVNADRFERSNGMVRFYRGTVVDREYADSMVIDLKEAGDAMVQTHKIMLAGHGRRLTDE